MLDVLFALDGQRNGFVPLVIDQHLHVVALGESFKRSFPVFEYASNEIIGNADVQRSTGPIREDIQPSAYSP